MDTRILRRCAALKHLAASLRGDRQVLRMLSIPMNSYMEREVGVCSHEETNKKYCGRTSI